jgi:hypothetical protein
MTGKAVMAYWSRAEEMKNDAAIQFSIEAAANATYSPMQKKLLDYASKGPEKLRSLATSSVSDPRVISLPGTQEFLEPLLEQLNRGAADKDRRKVLVSPLIRLFSRAAWNVPKTEEQQRSLFHLLRPKLDDAGSETNWYLADQLGSVLAENPDLHTPYLLKNVPSKYSGPLEEMYWLRSVPWMLTRDTPVPEVGASGGADAPLRKRAEDLYVRQLTASDERLRKAALAMASDEVIRRNDRIAKVLRESKPEYFEEPAEDVKTMNPEWRRNYEYFRNYVVPELNHANREDEQACLSCHGVKGRVPSMELAPADRVGYLNAKAVWSNYQTLLERVDGADVEKSKLLRKPLNIQTGTEDGHQGGRRYAPGDRGYEILRQWVMDAARLKRGEK